MGIEQAGAPLMFYNDPANLFVVGCIDSPEINLIAATATDNGAVTCDGIALPLPHRVNPDTRIIYGIRPQHITLGAAGVPDHISLVEPTGEDQVVIVSAETQDIAVVIHGGKLMLAGQDVRPGIDSDKVLLFDAATGERIR